jgi:hypothetical protein
MNSKQTNTKYEGAKRSGFAPAFHTMTGKFSASLFLIMAWRPRQTTTAVTGSLNGPP